MPDRGEQRAERIEADVVRRHRRRHHRDDRRRAAPTRAPRSRRTPMPTRTTRAARPAIRSPSVPPMPANPAQMPTALARSSAGKMLVIVESVPGMTSAAPIPMSARSPISWVGEPAPDRNERRAAEDGEADDQRAAPAVAVAEGAGRQQQRGQREPVGVDDPLLLGLARAEARRDRGERVGQHRHRRHHHQDRQAHDREDEVAPGRGEVRAGAGIGRARGGWGQQS